jgi:DnaJ-class molecular chaperone
MSKRDYYEILGLAKDSSDDDIKKAYRKMASKYHPDKFPIDGPEKIQAEATFKEAKESYECLSDSEKRAIYDQHGHNDPFIHNRGRTQNWSFNQGGIDPNDLNEIFSQVFGSHIFHGGFAQPQQTQKIHVISITLQDAYIGRTVNVGGNSSINLPRGIRSGTRLFGDGKIYRVDVLPDNKYKRSNDDLLIDIAINAFEAILGTEAILEHLDGVKLQFNIPAGMQFGQIIKLSGKGMKNPETDRFGDMLVRVSILIPKLQTLSEEQKIVLKAMNYRESINI